MHAMPVRKKRAEEYLEAIYMLQRTKGVPRIKDIARILNVRPASVVEYLDKLAQQGYVEYHKRDTLRLTEKGEALARKVYGKHRAITEFLETLLMLPRDIAEEDACYIEHGVHEETVERIIKLMEFLKQNRGDPKVSGFLEVLRNLYSS